MKLRLLLTAMLLSLHSCEPAFAQTKVTTNTTTHALIDPSEANFKSANHLTIGTDVQAQNSNLAALAGNTTTTIADGNVTLTLAGISAAQLTLTPATGTAPYFSSQISGGSGAGELTAVSNFLGNGLALKNLNASGYSATAFRASTGGEHAALGIGGSTAPIVTYQDNLYLEVTDLNSEGWTPSILVNQATTYGGTKTYQDNLRIMLNSLDGLLVILPRGIDAAGHLSDAEPAGIWFFDADAPILTASGAGDFRGTSADHALVLHNGGNLSTLYEYGGNYGSGSGVQINTGGARGSQTTRLWVCNDRTSIENIAHLVPQSAPGTPAEGDVWADTGHRLKYYDGTSTETLAKTSEIPTVPSAANPSASIGPSAVNGSATTFMRSDAAPAISQAITPTWTGLHTFSAGFSAVSPTLTGTPVAPTASTGTSTTQIATTAFVQAAIPAAPVILSSTTGINAKSVANTALYTVPTGKTCIVTGYVVRVDTGTSGITVGPSGGIGNTSGTNNIAASQAMTTLTGNSAASSVFAVPIVGLTAINAATSTIYYNNGTGATGTSMAVAIDLIGYIF